MSAHICPDGNAHDKRKIKGGCKVIQIFHSPAEGPFPDSRQHQRRYNSIPSRYCLAVLILPLQWYIQGRLRETVRRYLHRLRRGWQQSPVSGVINGRNKRCRIFRRKGGIDSFPGIFRSVSKSCGGVPLWIV